MKKTYINPEMEVVKIASQSQMMAGSLNPEGGSGTISEENAPADGDGEARGGFFFDDDDY